MNLTCSITDPSYLGGINVTQLFVLYSDEKSPMTSIIVNNTSILVTKRVTDGSYFCQIKTSKTTELMKYTVGSIKIPVICKLYVYNSCSVMHIQAIGRFLV